MQTIPQAEGQERNWAWEGLLQALCMCMTVPSCGVAAEAVLVSGHLSPLGHQRSHRETWDIGQSVNSGHMCYLKITASDSTFPTHSPRALRRFRSALPGAGTLSCSSPAAGLGTLGAPGVPFLPPSAVHSAQNECAGGGSREVITLLSKIFPHEIINLQRDVTGAGAGKASLELIWMEDAQREHPEVAATS